MDKAVITAGDRAAIESGSPLEDSRAFRRCLGQYATGVAVITASHNGQRIGMAVNSFAAVSLDPALVLWSIRRESASLPAFMEASHFAVNVLAAEQVDVSQVFGSGQPDRFARNAWTAGLSEAPLLEGAIAHFECQREAVHEGGDHLILVGRVERYARYAGEPLVFAQGQYAVSREHPLMAAKAGEQARLTPDLEQASFLRILAGANQHLSAQFDTHRREFGVNVASGRVMSRLYEADHTRADLEQDTYLGADDLDDALGDLLGQGLIAAGDGSAYQLTPQGRQKREALTCRAGDFIGKKLDALDPADVAAARRVLLALQE